MKNILLVALLPLLLAASCKKDKLADELSKLPPATQTGANTFGCLVNGKAWVPEGGCFLCPSVLKFYYDVSDGGQFSISAVINSGDKEENLVIGVDSCRYRLRHTYIKSAKNPLRFAYYNKKHPNCQWSTRLNDNVVCNGNITFTNFSPNEGLFAGSFNFTLQLMGCETITITEGRFDAKL